MEQDELEQHKAEIAAAVLACAPIMVTTDLLAAANARLLAYLAAEEPE